MPDGNYPLALREEDGGAMPPVLEPEPPQQFPPDIEAEIANLIEVLENTRDIAEGADGKWLGGFVGWDAVIGLLPGLGAIYSTYKQFQLQICAHRARCGFGTRLTGLTVGIFDICVGFVMGFGDLIDVFLRSSAIFGNAIEKEIERKLVIAQAYYERGDFSAPAMEALRNELFHRGQDAQTRQIKLVGGMMLLGLLLYSCAD